MTYSNNKNYIFGGIVLALALVFVVGLAGAPTAHAQYYDSGYGYDTSYYGGCDSGCYDSYSPTYYPPQYSAPTYHPAPTAPVVSALQVSCYPQPLTANIGDSATWVSNVFGGTGGYSYSWSGTDGLVGSGPSMSKVYYSSGSKSATLTVTSGNQTKSVSCDGSVNVYGNAYNYPVYTAPVYTAPTYQSLSVSCTPNITYTTTGSTVTWSANVYGGTGYNNGSYYNNYPTYSWSGTDLSYGYNNSQTMSVTYSTPGYKTASVTVTLNGQTATQTCSNTVNVTGYQYNYNNNYNSNYTYTNTNVSSNNNGLNVGCYSDPTRASLNQPVTWSVEVTGGTGPYTYSWSGSDGLTGTGSTLIKYYNAYGEKSAIVSVSSADGKTSTRACSNTVSIARPGGSVSGTTNTTTNTNATTTINSNTNQNGQSAAALFSLQNVPWGWIAILIILILFATVMYLIFNRPKI